MKPISSSEITANPELKDALADTLERLLEGSISAKCAQININAVRNGDAGVFPQNDDHAEDDKGL